MASILFDDITFPRELYDPDTLEFVAPVSTLLSFTPHILSQLAKNSAEDQEPLPDGWQGSGTSADAAASASSTAAAPNPPDVKTEGDAFSASSSTTTGAASGTQSAGTREGLFSSFSNLTNHQTLGNALYLAGRFMDGNSASSSSSSSARAYEQGREWERERTRERERYNRTSGTSYWFGASSSGYDHFNAHQERARLREMEDRLRAMERELDQNKAMARSEVEKQRRDRFNLEQDLETQREKVQKLEKEMETEKKKKEKEKEKKDQDEKEKEKKKQEEKEKETEKEKKKSSKEDGDKDDSSSKAVVKKDDTAQALLVAAVGVASLVMTMYSAHKASSTYSVVTFHSQLEQLMEQCDSVVQSTEAWISEQFLEVPDQIRHDLKLIQELMNIIQRLDPRSEKKAETVAWSMSAVGSLGAVGGAVVGSTMAMASGGTLVVGCALYGIISRARYNGPEYSAARTMLEHQAVKTLRALGVNPSASASSPSGGSRTSTIHENRLNRLRIEFEKREGHDLRDADEIDGLAVEDAMQTSSFSAPFVSQKKRANEDSELASLLAHAERQDQRPQLTMKREVAMA
ncbi:hypothetical protein EMPS_04875 [Entomortierella parvispora]|uniref:Uncharacterized protein n=1 Tax=Entomortierella parvispora TaxID=205924 RepID=A0A9P3LVX9_9FUNG|nr:hypothetical protein EMPS_04875 [Entomortierella parvispora]